MSALNRLRWKCRRGTLELDLLLQQFLLRDYAELDASAQCDFETLLEAGDEDLWAMLQGALAPPANCADILQRLRAC